MTARSTQALRARTAQILKFLDSPVYGVTRTSSLPLTGAAFFYATGAASWLFSPALAGALAATLTLRAALKGLRIRLDAAGFAAQSHPSMSAAERAAMQEIWGRWSIHAGKSALQALAFCAGAGLTPAIAYGLGTVLADPLEILMQALGTTGIALAWSLVFMSRRGYWVRPLRRVFGSSGSVQNTDI
ncbi:MULTISPECIES: hypothetical protein [unclassified Variovorax]|uniref:hypothetical protein n=1 Tax=unclassified Variovorax TaxID=663243 RepID=UPI000839211C|nr:MULTISPECIES: hypothetical protein [unclassified Variovorax]PNG49835.1 hypothetical protein CHC06_05416 [Variovorax sp. B2]PNG50707.1 hypothetical protein CHC07_05321 [Variovorax sp. B4]VTV17900.1 hypothetical protein WDL1P1_00754 [Variovorax sp. WDL1]